MLKVHEANSACKERFLTLIDAKNFVLPWYPSLTVQDVEISREDEEVTAWSTLFEWSGIGPAKPV